jgi:hypothetical protein
MIRDNHQCKSRTYVEIWLVARLVEQTMETVPKNSVAQRRVLEPMKDMVAAAEELVPTMEEPAPEHRRVSDR